MHLEHYPLLLFITLREFLNKSTPSNVFLFSEKVKVKVGSILVDGCKNRYLNLKIIGGVVKRK